MADMNGYSDPINHALAFAAKHHDQQVRRGTRLPYITAAPNIALILTRYRTRAFVTFLLSLALVSWLIVRSGLDADSIQPPEGGRAPGWESGLVVARRQQAQRDEPPRAT